MTIAFLLTTLVVVATPGTGAVYSIAAGLSRGSRAGIIAAFGCTLGVLPHMVAAITGLAAILHASAIAFQAIKWLGVAYLLYLAWHSAGPLRVPASVRARRPAQRHLADGGLERRVHGAYVRRVRPLRRVRGDGADPGDQPPQSHVVAAPHICRHLRPACRSPGRREPITNAVQPLTAAARPVPLAVVATLSVTGVTEAPDVADTPGRSGPRLGWPNGRRASSPRSPLGGAHSARWV
jgi:LysE type translocator